MSWELEEEGLLLCNNVRLLIMQAQRTAAKKTTCGSLITKKTHTQSWGEKHNVFNRNIFKRIDVKKPHGKRPSISLQEISSA